MPAPSLADATAIVTNNGLRTQYGLILPPGARVAAYVRSTGIQSGDDAFLAQNLVSTLAAGLARARPGLGDFVVCLPGHVENVADATTFSAALVAGTKIIGVGRGSNMPTFTWTTAASQWLIAVNDVQIAGLRLLFTGITAVAAAIAVTGSDFGFNFNDVEVSRTSFISVNGINLNAGSNRFDISGNLFRGTGTTSTGVTLNIAAAVDAGRISDNELLLPAGSSGAILVQAGTNLKILRNYINNSSAASIVGIAYSNAAITGQCAYNTITVLSTGAVSPGVTGITVGGTNNLTGYFQNFTVNDPNKSGLLTPAVDT